METPETSADHQHPICFDCGTPIRGVVVWLGETYPNDEKDYPFHASCARGAWPLQELRRTGPAHLLDLVDRRRR